LSPPARRCANGCPTGANRHSQPSVRSGPLWISGTGEQLSVRSISTIVTAAVTATGVEEDPPTFAVALRALDGHLHGLRLAGEALAGGDLILDRRAVRTIRADRRWPPGSRRTACGEHLRRRERLLRACAV
jgi:hypothetical protein